MPASEYKKKGFIQGTEDIKKKEEEEVEDEEKEGSQPE